MKGDVPLHLLHGLMDVAVENGYRTKSLQIGEGLLAIVCAPAPLRIDRPQRYMRKQDDRRAALQPGDILLEPGELVVAQRSETAGLQIHDVHEAHEMNSVAIEAMPAIAHGSLAKALAEHRAVVVEYVMFAGNIEDALGLQALERFGQRVELRRFREMSEVAGMQNERRGRRQCIHFGNRFTQGGGHVRIGRLIETDMAIADLNEAEVALEVTHVVLHDIAQREGLQNPAFHHAERPGARPGHTLQEPTTIDAVFVQIFLDVIRHDAIPPVGTPVRGLRFLCRHRRGRGTTRKYSPGGKKFASNYGRVGGCGETTSAEVLAVLEDDLTFSRASDC